LKDKHGNHPHIHGPDDHGPDRVGADDSHGATVTPAPQPKVQEPALQD
jgi:hypothetical protein